MGTEGFRLRARSYRITLLAHILTAVGWFGMAVFVLFAAIVAVTATDATTPEALYRAIELAPWLSVPAGLLAVASGVLLGLGTKWGVFQYWWVLIKIVIAAAVIVTDPLLIARGAHRAVETGQGPPWLYGPTVAHAVVLTIATVLSVFKPGSRTPWSRQSEPRP
jgi:hypothetical protein